MNDIRRKKPVHKRIVRIWWIGALLLAAGYFPTMMLKDARLSMVLAAAAVIPLGFKARTVWGGTLRAGLLGLVAAVGIAGGISGFYSRPVPLLLVTDYVALVSAMHASSAVEFGHVTGAGLCGMLTKQYGGAMLGRLILIYAASTVVMCAMSGTLSAFLADRHHQKIDQQWQADP